MERKGAPPFLGLKKKEKKKRRYSCHHLLRKNKIKRLHQKGLERHSLASSSDMTGRDSGREEKAYSSNF